MAIYHYFEIIGEFSLPPFFCITYIIIKKYYQGEPVNICIWSLIYIIQEKNRGNTTKKGKVKLPLFCGNLEKVIPFYADQSDAPIPEEIDDCINMEVLLPRGEGYQWAILADHKQ